MAIEARIRELDARHQSLEDLVDQSVGRALDLFGLDWAAVRRWGSDVGPGSGDRK